MNDDFSNDKVIPFPNLPLRLLDKGSNLLIEGRIKEAIPYLEKAEQLEPENPDILYTLIGAYGTRKFYQGENVVGRNGSHRSWGLL